MLTAKKLMKAEFLAAREAAAKMSLAELLDHDREYYNPLRRESLRDRAIIRRVRNEAKALAALEAEEEAFHAELRAAEQAANPPRPIRLEEHAGSLSDVLAAALAET